MHTFIYTYIETYLNTHICIQICSDTYKYTNHVHKLILKATPQWFMLRDNNDENTRVLTVYVFCRHYWNVVWVIRDMNRPFHSAEPSCEGMNLGPSRQPSRRYTIYPFLPYKTNLLSIWSQSKPGLQAEINSLIDDLLIRICPHHDS